MNLESIIAILANLVAIIVAAKNDTPIFSLFKKNFFDTNLTHYFFVGHEKPINHKGLSQKRVRTCDLLS